MSDLSPLSGVKRKLDFGAVRSAFDLGCVKTCAQSAQNCFLYCLVPTTIAALLFFKMIEVESPWFADVPTAFAP
jgi:hypothetical protein